MIISQKQIQQIITYLTGLVSVPYLSVTKEGREEILTLLYEINNQQPEKLIEIKD